MRLRTTLSRAVRSRLNPTPSSMNGDSRPSTSTEPASTAVDPGDRAQQRRLAGPVAPDDAEELAAVRRPTSRRAGHAARGPGAQRMERPFFEGVLRSRAGRKDLASPSPTIAAVPEFELSSPRSTAWTQSTFLRQRAAARAGATVRSRPAPAARFEHDRPISRDPPSAPGRRPGAARRTQSRGDRTQAQVSERRNCARGWIAPRADQRRDRRRRR